MPPQLQLGVAEPLLQHLIAAECAAPDVAASELGQAQSAMGRPRSVAR